MLFLDKYYQKHNCLLSLEKTVVIVIIIVLVAVVAVASVSAIHTHIAHFFRKNSKEEDRMINFSLSSTNSKIFLMLMTRILFQNPYIVFQSCTAVHTGSVL